MSSIAPVQVLYPSFAMFVLVSVVLLRMRSLRFAAVRNNTVPVGYYQTFQGAEEPAALRAISRNFSNLFEMPMLFYVGSLMAYVTGQVDVWMVGLAWLYVALRCVHSYVHLTSNKVMVRFSFYFASHFALMLMWLLLLVKLVVAG
jgi:hypothetical protein